MKTLYISNEADLYRKENTFFVKIDNNKHSMPIENYDHIIVLSDSTITTKLLSLAGKYDVRISFYDYYGCYCGSFEPACSMKSGKMKILQTNVFNDMKKRLIICREIENGIKHHMIKNLTYYKYNGNHDMDVFIKHINLLHEKYIHANTIEECMGIEGMQRRIYYEAWPKIDKNLYFGPRVKRPPNNPINCLISFLNSMTYTMMRHEITKTTLDENISFLHSPAQSRSSLSLDLSEVFKPIITDKIIFRLIRKKEISDTWFQKEDNVCLLNAIGKKNIVQIFKDHTEKEDNNGKCLKDYMLIDALSLQRYILGIADYESFKGG